MTPNEERQTETEVHGQTDRKLHVCIWRSFFWPKRSSDNLTKILEIQPELPFVACTLLPRSWFFPSVVFILDSSEQTVFCLLVCFLFSSHQTELHTSLFLFRMAWTNRWTQLSWCSYSGFTHTQLERASKTHWTAKEENFTQTVDLSPPDLATVWVGLYSIRRANTSLQPDDVHCRRPLATFPQTFLDVFGLRMCRWFPVTRSGRFEESGTNVPSLAQPLCLLVYFYFQSKAGPVAHFEHLRVETETLHPFPPDFWMYQLENWPKPR